MLKEVVLLRHAHAVYPSGWQADAQRPLSQVGRKEAFAAGAWLRENCPAPDVVLCSTALRTRETLVQLSRAGCALPAPEFEPRIYEASLGDLLEVIEIRMRAKSRPTRLWLIGHNPGLEQMLFHLDAAARLHAMTPGAIARLKMDARRPPTEPGAASIAATWAP